MIPISSVDPSQIDPTKTFQSFAQTGTDVLSSAAKALGMGESEVKSALKSGSSLSQIAAQKGVSEDTLLGAIKDGIAQSAITGTAGAGAPTGTRLDDMAQKIADRVPPQKAHHGHHGHHGGGHMKQVLDSVAAALGTDPAVIQQSIADGTTLSALATQKGVSQDTLMTAIKAGLTTNGTPAGASLDEVAAGIANRVPGQQPKSPYAGGDGTASAWTSSVDVVAS